MYADTVTASMNYAITETNRRRSIQDAYNKKHGITPKTIVKNIHEVIETLKPAKFEKQMTKEEKYKLKKKLTAEMKEAASLLDFEKAAELRDKIIMLGEK